MDNQQEENIEVYNMPRIGDQAPDFTAVTTTGTLPFLIMQKINGSSCSRILQTLRQYVPLK